MPLAKVKRSLATLSRASFDFFERLIRTFLDLKPCPANESAANHRTFLQEFQRFRIWIVDLGVLVPGHGSLDYRLRDTESLLNIFESYLDDLNSSLQETLEISNPNPGGIESPERTSAQSEDELSDEDDDSISEIQDEEEKEPQWYIDILLASVTKVIDQLYQLSTVVRNPAARLVSSKASLHQEIDADSGIDLIDAFSHFDHDYVLSVFREYHTRLSEDFRKQQSFPVRPEAAQSSLWHWPDGCAICEANIAPTRHDDSSSSGDPDTSKRWNDAEDATKFLVHRIARAINQRRQYFAYWKQHQIRVESHTETALASRPQVPNIFDRPTPEFPLGKRDDHHPTPLRLTDLLAPPTVTTATALSPSALLSVDTRSEMSVSEYAASDWDPGHENTQFPEPLKVGGADKFFTCPYCHTICPRNMLSEKAWKAHLIHDLRPYICTYPECHLANQLYDRRQDWVHHEDAFHRRQWRCSEHVDELYTTREGYIQHVKTDHQDDVDIMCTESHIRSCESASSKADRPCPVCFYSANDARASQSHLARHLERFALFSLPRSTEYGEKDDELGSAVAVEAMQSSRGLSSEASDDSSADWDSLTVAARIGDLGRVEDIIEGSFASDHDKDLALVEASALGHEAVVRILLKHGANANYADESSSPLIAASSSGHLGVVKDLINHGADVNAVIDFRHDGPNALIAAAVGGHANVVRELASAQADINALADIHTALASTAECGNDQMVELLINLGANVMSSRPDEPSPLAEAAAAGFENIVEILLRHGAVPNPKRDTSDLLGAVVKGRDTILDTLIAAGGDVNWCEQGISTLLESAVGTGDINIVRKLLMAGADPNMHGSASTALHCSASYDYADIARVLLEAGALPDAHDTLNETALHAACIEGNEGVVRVLIEKGADVNASSRRSGTPLQIALKSGHQKLADMLLEAGADQNPAEFHMNEFSQRQHLPVAGASESPNLHRAWDIRPASPNSAEIELKAMYDIPFDSLVACIEFSSDGRYLALGLPGVALIFETKEMSRKIELKHYDAVNKGEFVRSIAFSPDRKTLLTGSEDGKTRLWDISSAQVVDSWETASRTEVYAVAFSPRGTLFATGSADGNVDLYDIGQHDTTRNVSRKHGITSLVFSPGGDFLAIGDLGGQLTLLQIDKRHIFAFPLSHGHKDSVLSIAFSPDGSRLYSAGLDQAIICWTLVIDPESFFVATRKFSGHEDYVLSIAVFAGGRWLVSGSRDKTFRLWDTKSGELKVTVKGSKNSILSVAACQAQNLIAIASGEKRVTIWEYNPPRDKTDGRT